ncbi:MAG: NAD(P)/FAD-dependent oxidoreductase [Acidobacteriota bacterium]|nr:NAD(P)/FAD-dependent oxidoreductase [Acidobacteriota bacterium]
MSKRFDVVVLGGGPTGTATAIALAHSGRTVAVIERSNYDRVRVGETLPPRARLPLVDLGVWDRFINEGHAASPAILSAWGQDELYENHFIYNPYGHGWHIDRRRFDEMLALVAEEAGAVVCRGARVTACRPLASREWQVKFTSEGKPSDLQAGFLVDATGRASIVARRQRAERIFYDRLVGLVSFFSARSPEEEGDYQTLVEAVEEGWWYSAWLPNSQLVVAYMTDADLIPKGRARVNEHWQNRLAKAPHTSSRVGGCIHETILHSVAANSYRMHRITGTNWLAVGDAAIAFDPLSSQGIYNALQSGLRAAPAIERGLRGEQTALEEYELWTRKKFDEYLQMRVMHYSREQRWPSSAFWRRRQMHQDRGF